MTTNFTFHSKLFSCVNRALRVIMIMIMSIVIMVAVVMLMIMVMIMLDFLLTLVLIIIDDFFTLSLFIPVFQIKDSLLIEIVVNLL